MAIGTLYVVATPLGNLADFSPRALAIFKSISFLACEDTRETRKLLTHFKLSLPLISYHQHSGKGREEEIIARLMGGASGALVSDAGTPLLSDPGSELVRKVVAAGGKVVPIPGPSAVKTLLSVAGFPADQFYFAGFLPAKEGGRRQALERLGAFSCPVVFFEAPHRIKSTLQLLGELFPETPCCMGRELTKVYETITWGTPRALQAALPTPPRGEFTLVMMPKGDTQKSSPELTTVPEVVSYLLAKNLTRKEVAQALKILFPDRAKEFYRLTHELTSR